MRIGIDISQLAYPGTGVANYLKHLVEGLVEQDKENDYVLFFSSLRRNFQLSTFNFQSKSVKVKTLKLPPTVLDLIWNKLHIMPIESFIGPVDIFITSDWTEPPVNKAKKATILYDLIVYLHPEETDKKIIETQKRKHHWMKKETDLIFCISEATKKDAMKILSIPESKLQVSYPGVTI